MRRTRTKPRAPWHRGLATLFLATLAGSTHAAPGGASVISWGGAQASPPSSTTHSVIGIASGSYHNLALKTNRTVVGWGLDTSGQATPPMGLTNAQAIAAGASHSLALKADGTVVAWGENSDGQTNVPGNLTAVMAVAGGGAHSLALLNNGRVVGWGANNQGQAAPPFELTSGQSVAAAIAAGAEHSLAIKTVSGTGRVVGWGNNAYGQGRPPDILANGTVNVIAIAAGTWHSLALSADGRVYSWGNGDFGQLTPPANLTNVVAIAAGAFHSLAVKADGTVVAWGYDANGQTDVPGGLAGVTAVAGGASHSLALVFQPLIVLQAPQSQSVLAGTNVTLSVTADGVPPLRYQWQKNGTNLPGGVLSSLTLVNVQFSDAAAYTVNVSAGNGASTNLSATLTVNSPPVIQEQPHDLTVLAGQLATFRVTATGTGLLLYQWRHEGLTLPGAINAVCSIVNPQPPSAGRYDVVVRNDYGAVTSQVAILTVNEAPLILVHPRSQTVLLGSSVTFGVTATAVSGYQWRKGSVALVGATNATYTINSAQLSDAGDYRVLVSNSFGSALSNPATLTVDKPGTTSTNVVVWGQLLVFNGSAYTDMRAPGGLGSLRSLAAGAAHNLALRTDSTVVGWGDNSRGQSAPPAGVSNVTAIAAGAYHSLALRDNGTVVAWGDANAGQSSVPPGLSLVRAIAAGADHSLAVQNDGTVTGWGGNSVGQSTPPPGTVGLVTAAAGTRFSLGLRANGTVAGWGENEYGQTRPPASLSNVVAIAAGDSHSMALRDDGRVFVWGRNHLGQTNVPSSLSTVVAIAAGADHCLALQRDGTVVGWGQNNEGQVDTPAALAAVAIAAGGHRSLASKQNVYRLWNPERQPNGAWRLRIGHLDPSPVDASEATSLQVQASVNPTLSLSNWIRLSHPLIPENGLLRIDDTTIGPSKRFYIVTPKP